jgi:NADPH-dependent 2,4-dienoyl-CoA reductase/sulfur reductase-like enzyme
MGVFNLDVMEDAIAIHDYLERYEPKRAVVVGGGYIGLEMVENLWRLGLKVQLVELGNQLFPWVDRDLAAIVAEELTRQGVDMSLCDSVLQACEGRGGRVHEVTTNQGTVAADMVLLAVGVRPNVEVVAAAGIELGATGAIAVDRQLRTNVPNVYAAGDCAEHWHRVMRKPAWVPLGTTANKQGRIVGRNVTGNNDAFAGIVGTAATRIFDVEVARTGLSEEEARRAGFETVSGSLTTTDVAGYMPDAQPLTVKLLAEAGTGRLLGGQAVGRAGAAKRIDVLATALFNDLDLSALIELDLAYAPPVNSVWDPLQATATKVLRRERVSERKEAEE